MQNIKLGDKVWYLFIVVGTLLGLFVLDYIYSYQKTLDSLNIELKQSPTIEYGDPFDINDLVISSNGNLYVNGNVDNKKVGDYDLEYIVQDRDKYNRNIIKSQKINVKVVDSKAPIITLKEDHVNVYLNSDYDFNENIESIIDIVDGDIPENKIKFESDVDLKTLGDYKVKVIAEDNNGLKSEAEYLITVKRRPSAYAGGNYSYIYNYLSNNFGYSKAVTCGILANIKFESTFNPEVDTGTYFGLCQWGGGRRSNLFTWCEANGYDAYSVDGQLEYMNYEFINRYGGTRNAVLSVDESATGAYDAAVIFCNGFEGAATSAGRGELAATYYDME